MSITAFIIITTVLLISIGINLFLFLHSRKTTRSEANLETEPSLPSEAPEIEITEEFAKAFDLIENRGENALITGKAGTGKSTFLEYFIKNTKKRTVVLAPTGIAAMNVGGMTIHSFFHFPIRPITIDDLKKYSDDPVYLNLDCIVIDEISMVRADLLDAIHGALMVRRWNKKPFGGVQIVLIGDLYQLPPVVADKEVSKKFSSYYSSRWFFEAKIFESVTLHVVELTRVFRQKDALFIEILDRIRKRKLTLQDLTLINQQCIPGHKLDFSKDNLPIILTPTNRNAKGINNYKLRKLPGKEYSYEAKIIGEFPEKSLPTERNLRLKIGAQVMFIKNNFNRNWVNGTIGVIEELDHNSIKVNIENPEGESYSYLVEKETWEVYKYQYNYDNHQLNAEVIGQFIQYPLKLAWAITIHKSQGLTFDQLILDLDWGAFDSGQVYVALSRSTSLSGLQLKMPIKYGDIRVDPHVAKFYQSLREGNPHFPIIE